MCVIVLFVLIACSIFNITTVESQSCSSDCVGVKSCPQAVNILKSGDQAYMRSVLRQSYCGYYVGNEPSVCCPQISSNPENHPNLKLLPSPLACGVKNGNRVFGGVESDPNEYPWMVLLGYRTKRGREFKCGGTLISDRYVLTAAHCITKLGRSMVLSAVRIGEHSLETEEDHAQDISVEESIAHELYQSIPFVRHDIGLVRLSRRVNFMEKDAGPICLPITRSLREVDLEDTSGIIAGWGETEKGTASKQLLKLNITIWSDQRCRSFWLKGEATELDFQHKYCAGERNKDSCSGDSGGPLMVLGSLRGSRYIQQGIISYGALKCGTGVPGVYTAVRNYMGWILDHIRR